MSIFHPSIFFIHIQTFAKIIYYNCFKHFSWRRVLFTVPVLACFLLHYVLFVSFRILDEIFFPAYKNTKITAPVFIISNPRCGTTFLHRLMALDGKRYNYTRLYETIYPSVTFLKLFTVFATLDGMLGGPLKAFWKFADDMLFGGWKDIHPMGFNETEEDEGMFAIAGITPAMMLFSPYLVHYHTLDFLDKASPKLKMRIKEYYLSSLKRFMYATNPDATLLVKNVFSSGRIEWILEMFPDAKIVYPMRNPYEAIPSVVSMFTTPWGFHSPDVPENSEYHKTFAQLMISYYDYVYSWHKKLPENTFVTIEYSAFIKQPKETVLEIYKKLGFEASSAFEKALTENSMRSKSYKSKHHYTLEQFGLTKEMIREPLKELFDEYGFE